MRRNEKGCQFQCFIDSLGIPGIKIHGPDKTEQFVSLTEREENNTFYAGFDKR